MTTTDEVLARTWAIDGVELRAAKGDEDRTMTVRAVPYNRETNLWGDVFETFLPGAFRGQEKAARRVRLTDTHYGRPFGRATDMEDRSDGLHVTFRIPQHADMPHAREMLALVETGILDEVSIGFRAVKGGSREVQRKAGGVLIERTKASLDHVALVARGAYGDAGKGSKVLSVREELEAAAPHLRALLAYLDGKPPLRS